MPYFHCRRHWFRSWLDELISSLLHGQKQRRGRKERKERQEPNKAEHERLRVPKGVRQNQFR